MGEVTVAAADQPGPAAVILPADVEADVLDRTTPIFRVLADDEPFTETAHQELVSGIFVEENVEMIDLAIVELSNVPIDITNDRLFREGVKLSIFNGYVTTPVAFRGDFFMRRPRFQFFPSSVKMTADGEEIKLARDERRRIFLGKTHSEIAQQIATENELEADVDTTTIQYPQISQMNESDLSLLKRLAKFNGFIVYVERGTLHFHALRTVDSGVEISLRPAGQGVVSHIEIEIQGEGRSIALQATQFDPLEGAVISATSQNLPDGVLDPAEAVQGLRRFSDLSAVRTVFLTQEGHLLTQEELQRQVDAFAESRKFVVRLRVESLGIETVRARELVTFEGLGRFSGKYFVKSVQHRIGSFASGGYTMNIEAVRSSTGDLLTIPELDELTEEIFRRGPLDDVTSQSPPEGELDLSTGGVTIF